MMERLVAPRGHVGSIISKSVLAWAKEHGAAATPWHQDEPIWYVSRDETKQEWLLSMYVQLTTCVNDESSDFLRMKATPGARAINESLSLAKVLNEVPEAEEAPIVAGDNKSIEALVKELLEEAWRRAEKLDPWQVDQFIDETLPS